jgi:hypothetical protein
MALQLNVLVHTANKVGKLKKKQSRIATILLIRKAPQPALISTNFKPSGTNRNNAIAKELANRSAYQTQYVNEVIVNIVFKV